MKQIAKRLAVFIAISLVLSSVASAETENVETEEVETEIDSATYQDAVVKTRCGYHGADGRWHILYGTGFFVEGNYLITAAHCAIDNNNNVLENVKIQFIFQGKDVIKESRWAECEIIGCDMDNDIVVAKGTDWTSTRSVPLNINTDSIEANDSGVIVGFPKSNTETGMITVSTGNELSTVYETNFIKGIIVVYQINGEIFTIRDAMKFDTVVSSGVSGAPVIMDGKTVGVVSGTIYDGSGTWASKIVYAKTIIDEYEKTLTGEDIDAEFVA